MNIEIFLQKWNLKNVLSHYLKMISCLVTFNFTGPKISKPAKILKTARIMNQVKYEVIMKIFEQKYLQVFIGLTQMFPDLQYRWSWLFYECNCIIFFLQIFCDMEKGFAEVKANQHTFLQAQLCAISFFLQTYHLNHLMKNWNF